ncbi:hypothetical protein GCM10023176_34300 [Micromonospora coerulea]|uniref:Uncharacterized protein n=1 Tax=Micromonospora coerulea TaxID=47856 RepID=A0ABP8SPI4_9ACTN
MHPRWRPATPPPSPRPDQAATGIKQPNNPKEIYGWSIRTGAPDLLPSGLDVGAEPDGSTSRTCLTR